LKVSNNAGRFHVITGGPGSGKTAIIDVLRSRGYPCSVEAGRGIIEDHGSIDGPALPWRDPMLFSELMLSWEMRSYHEAEQSTGPVFFDRGVPDVLGYLRLIDVPALAHIQKAATTFRYNRTVFIAPPWPEIFRQDRERKQDFDESVRTYEAMVTTYVTLAYHLIEIPRLPIEDRVLFILDHLAHNPVNER
jgi:predicted ATPase